MPSRMWELATRPIFEPGAFHPVFQSGFYCDLCRIVHISSTSHFLMPKPNRAPGKLAICTPQLKLLLGVAPLNQLYAERYSFPKIAGDHLLKVFPTLEEYVASLSRGGIRKLKQCGYDVVVPKRTKDPNRPKRHKRGGRRDRD